MLAFLGGNVVTVDDDDLTIPSRSIRLCAFDDGVQDGKTALHLAASRGHADCVELLLKHMDREGVQLKNDVRNLKRSLSLSLSSSTRAKTTTTRSLVERDDFCLSFRRGERFGIFYSISVNMKRLYLSPV